LASRTIIVLFPVKPKDTFMFQSSASEFEKFMAQTV